MNSQLLVGNWKMNLNCAQSKALAQAVVQHAGMLKRTEIWLSPATINISALADSVRGTSVKLGAQNVHWENGGAFTGETSPDMLKNYGCSFAIVGHSERRHIFAESIELAVRRARGALACELTIIFCVGETAQQRNEGETNEVIGAQLSPLLSELPESAFHRVIIAYEPVWAIGTGNVASLAQIQEMHRSIGKMWSKNVKSCAPRILYGGSVSPANWGDISALPEVSGALVGGASLKAESFLALADICERS